MFFGVMFSLYNYFKLVLSYESVKLIYEIVLLWESSDHVYLCTARELYLCVPPSCYFPVLLMTNVHTLLFIFDKLPAQKHISVYSSMAFITQS